MRTPPVVAIYGHSDSGKTGLIVELVRKLDKEGLRVCTVKHSPEGTSLDKEGKDTWRHRQGGSRLTVLSTETETAFLVPGELKLEEIVRALGSLEDPDLVLAEGYKEEDLPKIAVGEIAPRDNTIHRYEGDIAALREVIQQVMEVKEIENELPGLNCGRCGYENCSGLAGAIYHGQEEMDDCVVRKGGRVRLKVDGEEVPLENFPARFVEGGLKGMLGALKGVDDEAESISLEIGG